MNRQWKAVDLFCGCGGLTLGLKRSGFDVVSAVENDGLASSTYARNHPEVKLIEEDICRVKPSELRSREAQKIHLVAGCPPCQGFSRVRRKNRARSVSDKRNWLIDEFLHIVEELLPSAVFLENVPGIQNYRRFKSFLSSIRRIGYHATCEQVELSDYAVPQRRRRVVVLAGYGFDIGIPRKAKTMGTVRSAIGDLPPPEQSRFHIHQRITKHSPAMLERIRAVPRDGGSRQDWPDDLKLDCHSTFDGFKDVYGRMAWDAPSPTITGGCINASKGRFIHPEQDRAITLLDPLQARIAARKTPEKRQNGLYIGFKLF